MHQVHFVIAPHAIGLFVVFERGVLIIHISAIHDHVGWLCVPVRNRALVQVHGMIFGVQVGNGIRCISLDATCAIDEILVGGDRRVKLYRGGQMAVVFILIARKFVEAEVLIIEDKTLFSAIRHNGSGHRHIHYGKTVRFKVGCCHRGRLENYLGPVPDKGHVGKLRQQIITGNVLTVLITDILLGIRIDGGRHIIQVYHPPVAGLSFFAKEAGEHVRVTSERDASRGRISDEMDTAFGVGQGNGELVGIQGYRLGDFFFARCIPKRVLVSARGTYLRGLFIILQITAAAEDGHVHIVNFAHLSQHGLGIHTFAKTGEGNFHHLPLGRR